MPPLCRIDVAAAWATSCRVAVEDGGARVGTLDDELRARGAYHRDRGFLGRGGEPVADDLVLEAGGGGTVRHPDRPPAERTTACAGSTRADHPAGTSTVASGDSRSTGPASVRSLGQTARRRTGVATKPPEPASQTSRVPVAPAVGPAGSAERRNRVRDGQGRAEADADELDRARVSDAERVAVALEERLAERVDRNRRDRSRGQRDVQLVGLARVADVDRAVEAHGVAIVAAEVASRGRFELVEDAGQPVEVDVVTGGPDRLHELGPQVGREQAERGRDPAGGRDDHRGDVEAFRDAASRAVGRRRPTRPM